VGDSRQNLLVDYSGYLAAQFYCFAVNKVEKKGKKRTPREPWYLSLTKTLPFKVLKARKTVFLGDVFLVRRVRK